MGITLLKHYRTVINLFECALYGDIEIVLRRLRAEALKKMVSHK